MAARPPGNDEEDAPDSMAFGIAALDARIENRDVSFPISIDELRESCGDMQIAIDPSGTEIAFATILDQCTRDSFENRQDLLNALHPIFEAERERKSSGVIGRLRQFVPF